MARVLRREFTPKFIIGFERGAQITHDQPLHGGRGEPRARNFARVNFFQTSPEKLFGAYETATVTKCLVFWLQKTESSISFLQCNSDLS